jgi:hypothetical protein
MILWYRLVSIFQTANYGSHSAVSCLIADFIQHLCHFVTSLVPKSISILESEILLFFPSLRMSYQALRGYSLNFNYNTATIFNKDFGFFFSLSGDRYIRST